MQANRQQSNAAGGAAAARVDRAAGGDRPAGRPAAAGAGAGAAAGGAAQNRDNGQRGRQNVNDNLVFPGMDDLDMDAFRNNRIRIDSIQL